MISVCMATFNGERFIKEQLESILSQLPSGDDCAEVLIADDGSTDGTLDIVRGLKDSRIRIVTDESSPKHLGPVYNFERALAAAVGEVIFLADQDDVWEPTKVQAVMEALKNAVLVTHNANFLGNSSNNGSMWNARPFKTGVFRNWLKNSYTGCCMAFKRELLKKVLPFPKNLPMHDQWIGVMAEKAFGKKSVVGLSQPLILYRLHDNNATQLLGPSEGSDKANAKMTRCFLRVIWRLNLLRALLTRC